MRDLLLPLLLAGAALAPAGCATVAADVEAEAVAAGLTPVTAAALAGAWRIESVGAKALTDRAFTLDFAAGGAVTGALSCNSLSGTWRIEGEALRFAVDQTALGCRGGENERLERAGRAVWGASRAGLTADGRRLVFEGVERVVFARRSATS
jgi:heat shock protein HslJ